MHSLPALKQAALKAFETEDGPGDMTGFFSLIDPEPVLALVESEPHREMLETILSDYY